MGPHRNRPRKVRPANSIRKAATDHDSSSGSIDELDLQQGTSRVPFPPPAAGPSAGSVEDKARPHESGEHRNEQEEQARFLSPRLGATLTPREEPEVTSPLRSRPPHAPQYPSEDEMDDITARRTLVFSPSRTKKSGFFA